MCLNMAIIFRVLMEALSFIHFFLIQIILCRNIKGLLLPRPRILFLGSDLVQPFTKILYEGPWKGMNLEDFNFDALPSRINIPRELEPSIWIDRQTDIGFTRYFFKTKVV